MSRKGITFSAFFEKLGAQRKNNRWSWGAVRTEDGAVFLGVWQDEIKKEGNTEFVHVAANKNPSPNDHGYRERLQHLALIENGANSYMIICVAKDVDEDPRTIDHFNSEEIYIGGKPKNVDGEYYLEIGDCQLFYMRMPSVSSNVSYQNMAMMLSNVR